MVCSNWLTVEDIVERGCVPETYTTALDGIDWSDEPNWTEEQIAAITVIQNEYETAQDIVYIVTGQQYPGICRAVLRPCPQYCTCGGLSVYRSPTMRTSTECRCQAKKLRLYNLPFPLLTKDGNGNPLYTQRLADESLEHRVPFILGVDKDSNVFNYTLNTEYYLDWPDTIVLYDGNSWPLQRIGYPMCTNGTWALEIAYGDFPTESIITATVKLTEAFLQRVCGATECQLPAGVSSMIMHGTILKLSSAEDYAQLRTQLSKWFSGVPDVDVLLWPHLESGGGRVLTARIDRTVWVDDSVIFDCRLT